MLLMARKSDRDVETDQVSIRLSSTLLNRLEKIADTYGVKRSFLIQQAILEYVMKCEHQGQTQHGQPQKPAR